MSLIELFTDYVIHRKDLNEYAAVRRSLNEKGVFSDALLAQAQDNLSRLKHDEPGIYNEMYATLEKIYLSDRGYSVEYPIDFIAQIINLYALSTPAATLRNYRQVLEHYHHDA